MRDAIVEHMNSNTLFLNSQYNFRSPLDVIDKWTIWNDEGTIFDCIYYDFQQAFDTVPHKRLLVKLQSYDLTGKLLIRIKEFLAYRKQPVIVNNSLSDWTEITSGISQKKPVRANAAPRLY